MKSKYEGRDKLGLCLAGGGFRASLFHLGVFRRMAELDLLRYVEVLSTVSGGSIIGALYALKLKEYLDQKDKLTQEEYERIVYELEQILVKGIQKDLRTRLFMNPLKTLWVMVSSETLGKAMSRLYARHFYRPVAKKLKGLKRSFFDEKLERVPLKEILIRQGGESIKHGLEKYNKDAVKNGTQGGAVITKLVMNATSLNSGRPFTFSGVEIGDDVLGFCRYDEIDELMIRKHLLHKYNIEELQNALDNAQGGVVLIKGKTYNRKTVSLALWWRERHIDGIKKTIPYGWENLFKSVSGFPGCLVETELGLLRHMKLSAWYLRVGPFKDPPVTGGLSPEVYRDQACGKLYEINMDMADAFESAMEHDPGLSDLFLDFVLELYYLRSAEVFDWKIKKHWERLTLHEAVGASACFPPVFPPFIMLGIYDDLHVTRLGLTDGGVYDNVGLTSLLEENCTHIIASDTSGLFDTQKQSSEGRIGMSGRIVSILMDDVAQQQRERVRELKKCGKLRGLSFFHIKSRPIGKGLDLPFDRRHVAALRTDLDGFGEVEIAALVNEGYNMADRYIREYFKDTIYFDQKRFDKEKKEHEQSGTMRQYWQPPQKVPVEMEPEIEVVEKILKAGKSRFFRIFKLHPVPTWGLTLILAALLSWKTWNMKFVLANIANSLMKALLHWLTSLVPVDGDKLITSKLSIGLTVAVLLGVALLWPASKYFRKKLQNRWFKLGRLVLKAGKRFRAHAGIIFIPFGLLPIVVSLVGAIIGCISFVFFNLPFLYATRNRKK